MTIQWSCVSHIHVPHPWLKVLNKILWVLLFTDHQSPLGLNKTFQPRQQQAKVRIRIRVTRGT